MINTLKANQILRYLVSGGVAALVLFISLYVLKEFLNVWYLYSSIVSFILATITSFIFQKFWTFQDKRIDIVHEQAVAFLSLSTLNFFINTGLMYLFVDIFNIWYFTSQVITTGIIAFGSFFIYKFLIFKNIESSLTDLQN